MTLQIETGVTFWYIFDTDHFRFFQNRRKMFRPLLLLALTRGQEVEIQSLEELNIEDIDENGADFAVLGDTSHIDHREIDEGSREARGWGEQHDWVTLLDAMIEG